MDSLRREEGDGDGEKEGEICWFCGVIGGFVRVFGEVLVLSLISLFCLMAEMQLRAMRMKRNANFVSLPSKNDGQLPLTSIRFLMISMTESYWPF